MVAHITIGLAAVAGPEAIKGHCHKREKKLAKLVQI
jgi:hypothetical protein